jgi:RNA polymerase sigma-70 factor, ECF subfamily
MVAEPSSIPSDPAGRLRRTVSRADPSEAELVRAAQNGSEAAVEKLFSRHWPDAYRSAYLVTGDRAAAEDIAQEAFISALRALARFDRRRPLRPWLHRIVVNRAIDWSRARRLRNEVTSGLVDEAADPTTEPSDLDHLISALRRLTPDQRGAVVLRYLLDFTPGEIARLLDVPRGTVNSRLRRGLDALAEDIGVEER